VTRFEKQLKNFFRGKTYPMTSMDLKRLEKILARRIDELLRANRYEADVVVEECEKVASKIMALPE